MRQALVILAAVALIATGCASNNANGRVPEPDVTIEQMNSMPVVAQEVTGGIPVSLRITVTNRAAIPITLERATLTTLGIGGWTADTSHTFANGTVPPGATNAYQFWIAGESSTSVAGANTPVRIRVITQYNSSEGRFERTIVAPVGGEIR